MNTIALAWGHGGSAGGLSVGGGLLVASPELNRKGQVIG